MPHSEAAIIDGFAAAMTQIASSPSVRSQRAQHALVKVRQEYDREFQQ